jgi:hypothetical protein
MARIGVKETVDPCYIGAIVLNETLDRTTIAIIERYHPESP